MQTACLAVIRLTCRISKSVAPGRRRIHSPFSSLPEGCFGKVEEGYRGLELLLAPKPESLSQVLASDKRDSWRTGEASAESSIAGGGSMVRRGLSSCPLLSIDRREASMAGGLASMNG